MLLLTSHRFFWVIWFGATCEWVLATEKVGHMHEFNDGKPSQMPVFFGEYRKDPRHKAIYHDVTNIVISYLTDRDEVARYLPKPFELPEEPIITVTSSQCREVEFLAGRGYNLLSVAVSAMYDKEPEMLRAPFIFVMWENLTDPIIAGREQLGVPKLFADIPDHQYFDGAWHSELSRYGSKIVELHACDLEEVSVDELRKMNEAGKNADSFGWQYFHAIGELGPAVSNPTLFPKETTTSRAWNATGSIKWSQTTWEQNPIQSHISNAIGDWPILEIRSTRVTKGTSNLSVAGRPPRVLAK